MIKRIGGLLGNISLKQTTALLEIYISEYYDIYILHSTESDTLLSELIQLNVTPKEGIIR